MLYHLKTNPPVSQTVHLTIFHNNKKKSYLIENNLNTFFFSVFSCNFFFFPLEKNDLFVQVQLHHRTLYLRATFLLTLIFNKKDSSLKIMTSLE